MSKAFGLLGHKIGYSKSKVLHELIANVFDLDITYDLFDVETKDIENYLNDVRHGKLSGLNVTKPYKEFVIPFLDELSNSAKQIGAVNTIYLKNNKLIGDNTDYDGFIKLIEKNQIDVVNKKVVILGTGGAAKAVYEVLKKYTRNIFYVSRKKTDECTITYNDLNTINYDVIIQATPVGTYPNIEDSMLSKEYVSGKVVIDLVYNPKVTKIMSMAKEAYNGIDMLIYQAISSQEHWHSTTFYLSPENYEKIKEKLV